MFCSRPVNADECDEATGDDSVDENEDAGNEKEYQQEEENMNELKNLT